MRNFSLRTKIIFILSLVITFIMSITSFYAIRSQVKDFEKFIRDKAELITNLQSKTLSQALWDFDEEAISSSLQGLLKDTDFFAATIYDDTGEVFSKIENKKAIESDNFKINSNIIYVDNTKKEKILEK